MNRLDGFERLMVTFGALAVLIVASVIGFGVYSALHVETATCTVVGKDRTTTSDGGSDARLYTEDCGVLRVGDSLFSWTFSSADTYAGIDAGKTYAVKTRGLRIPFLSMFPNVVEAREVPTVGGA